MTDPAETAPSFLTSREVARLLHIARSTVTSWREAGLLIGHPLPNGEWRYRNDQPTIVAAREALAKSLRDVIPAGQLTLDADA
jgi:predicted site-specific integrase-resolvase